MEKNLKFIHLRCHSEYSLLEGALRLKKLPELASAMDMPAIAVTDTNNMFCALEFSEVALEAGIQPIIGCQVDLAYDPAAPGEKIRLPAPVVLLAQNERGYENLLMLNSHLYLNSNGELPQVQISELLAHTEGVICLTGGSDGPLGRLLQAGQLAKAQSLVIKLAQGFGDRLYVELQRHPSEDGVVPDAERLSERGLVDLAYSMDLPLVATNDVYFDQTKMYEAHDALICIADGSYVDQQEPRRRLTPQHYLKTQAEMAILFADLPEALENTVEVARRCAFKVYKRDPILPKFADNEVDELRRKSNEGLRQRLAVIQHAVSEEEYQKRLDFELDTIEAVSYTHLTLPTTPYV